MWAHAYPNIVKTAPTIIGAPGQLGVQPIPEDPEQLKELGRLVSLLAQLLKERIEFPNAEESMMAARTLVESRPPLDSSVGEGVSGGEGTSSAEGSKAQDATAVLKQVWENLEVAVGELSIRAGYAGIGTGESLFQEIQRKEKEHKANVERLEGMLKDKTAEMEAVVQKKDAQIEELGKLQAVQDRSIAELREQNDSLKEMVDKIATLKDLYV